MNTAAIFPTLPLEPDVHVWALAMVLEEVLNNMSFVQLNS